MEYSLPSNDATPAETVFQRPPSMAAIRRSVPPAPSVISTFRYVILSPFIGPRGPASATSDAQSACPKIANHGRRWFWGVGRSPATNPRQSTPYGPVAWIGSPIARESYHRAYSLRRFSFLPLWPSRAGIHSTVTCQGLTPANPVAALAHWSTSIANRRSSTAGVSPLPNAAE